MNSNPFFCSATTGSSKQLSTIGQQKFIHTHLSIQSIFLLSLPAAHMWTAVAIKYSGGPSRLIELKEKQHLVFGECVTYTHKPSYCILYCMHRGYQGWKIWFLLLFSIHFYVFLLEALLFQFHFPLWFYMQIEYHRETGRRENRAEKIEVKTFVVHHTMPGSPHSGVWYSEKDENWEWKKNTNTTWELSYFTYFLFFFLFSDIFISKCHRTEWYWTAWWRWTHRRRQQTIEEIRDTPL